MEENLKEETKVEKTEKKEKKNKKESQIEELNNMLEDAKQEALRAKADLINYRKRKDDEVSHLLKYKDAEMIMSLLPILDNFERVINKEDVNDEVKNYLEGFKLIYNNLKSILEKNEVKEIEALGKEFDPTYHHSVSMVKDETKEQGIILEVYQKGYTYKDKVLRPAMVIINE